MNLEGCKKISWEVNKAQLHLRDTDQNWIPISVLQNFLYQEHNKSLFLFHTCIIKCTYAMEWNSSQSFSHWKDINFDQTVIYSMY